MTPAYGAAGERTSRIFYVPADGTVKGLRVDAILFGVVLLHHVEQLLV